MIQLILAIIILTASLLTEGYRIYQFFSIDFGVTISLGLSLIFCIGFLLIHLYKPRFSLVYTVLIGILSFYVMSIDTQKWLENGKNPLYIPHKNSPIYEQKFRYYQQELNYVADLKRQQEKIEKENRAIDEENKRRKLESEIFPLAEFIRRVFQSLVLSIIFPALMYISLSAISNSITQLAESKKIKEDKTRRAIIDEFKRGVAVTEIAKKHNLSRQKIYRIAESAGVHTRTASKSGWTEGLEGGTE